MVSISSDGTIRDSGARREFDSGAVRDIALGKGRTDLIPWDCSLFEILFSDDATLLSIGKFYKSRDTKYLADIMYDFATKNFGDLESAMLELSVHFEAGAEKYGEYNWQKGIPVHSYLDSAVRHYLKWKRGDRDERHDRAFMWNIICLVWTQDNLPNMDDLNIMMTVSQWLHKQWIRFRLWLHRVRLSFRLQKSYMRRQ